MALASGLPDGGRRKLMEEAFLYADPRLWPWAREPLYLVARPQHSTSPPYPSVLYCMYRDLLQPLGRGQSPCDKPASLHERFEALTAGGADANAGPL